MRAMAASRALAWIAEGGVRGGGWRLAVNGWQLEWDLGFGVWGLGFGVWGLRCAIWGFDGVRV